MRMLTDKMSSPREDSQAIGHSSNVPWPNLKKLTVPASTTAMTTDLLPCRSAMNGLILTVVGPEVGCEEYNRKYDNNLIRKDGGDIVSCLLGGAGRGATGFWEGGLRLRGTGGGRKGSPSYMCVNSASVGIGIVRALGKNRPRLAKLSLGWEQNTHLTTTIEKSGGGGAVLRNGVLGLCKW